MDVTLSPALIGGAFLLAILWPQNLERFSDDNALDGSWRRARKSTLKLPAQRPQLLVGRFRPELCHISLKLIHNRSRPIAQLGQPGRVRGQLRDLHYVAEGVFSEWLWLVSHATLLPPPRQLTSWRHEPRVQ